MEIVAKFYVLFRYMFWRVQFMAEFETKSGEWTEVFVPFDELKGSHWGRDMPDRRFNKSRVYKFSILIADKIEGPFRLEVDWIKSE